MDSAATANKQRAQLTFAELFTPKLATMLRAGYSAADFRADALAGLTVAIVALPLSMAIAIGSGLSPEKGLFTAIVGGFLISALGGSRFQIGGPAGAFIVLIATIVERHGYDGLVLATLMAGVMMLAAGFLRLGTYIKYIPFPVTVGFTAGIAVIIFASQLKELLGLDIAHADIGKFRKQWPAGTPQRIALEILLHTGLRRSDAVKLGRQHRDGNRHVVSLKKSGETVTVYIPVHPTLEKHLATLSGTCLTYIQTVRGVARSEKAFTNWIGEAADAAGLPPNSSPHGLRKACCRRLAEAGCTSAQISAITGQSIAVIERYIRDFNREKAAEVAMASIKDDFDENEEQTKTG